MHELAVCNALLAEVDRVARSRGMHTVCEINVDVGPLSGVVPDLLRRAFEVARAGTRAEGATLILRQMGVRVCCERCNEVADATANDLCCPRCGAWDTRLLRGDELILRDVVLERPSSGAPREARSGADV